MRFYLLPFLAASVLLAACATGDKEPAARGIAVFEGDPRLGPQVSSACYGSEIEGFRDTRKNSVIIETRRNREYLITARACFDLSFALSLGVDSRGGCLSQGDRLVYSDSIVTPNIGIASDIETCRIDGVYEWSEGAAEPVVETDVEAEN